MTLGVELAPAPRSAKNLGARATLPAPHPVQAQPTTREEEPEMLAREKWQAKTITVLDMVFAERVRQVGQYGHNQDLEDGFGPETRWAAPLRPDMTAQEIQQSFRLQYEAIEAAGGTVTWMHLLREEFAEWLESDPNSSDAVMEALQVAALLVSWAEKKL